MQNKEEKVFLIVLLSLIVIALLGVMIFFMINKDYQVSFFAFGNGTEMIFEKEYDSKEINNIIMNVGSMNVKFRESNADKIKVTIYGDKRQKINETITEHELKIEKAPNTFYLFAFFCWVREEAIVELPKEYIEKLQVNTSSGDIEVLDLENVDLQIESTSGNITCGNMHNGYLKTTSGNINAGSSNEMIAKSTSGDIKIQNAKTGRLEAVSGDIEANEIETIDAKSTSGTINLDKANKVVARTTSGNIRINTINEKCELSSVSGNITVDSCSLIENSTMQSTSGDVRISKGSNMYIDTKTTSGDVRIENNNRKAEIELKIKTTSGNITAMIEE